MTSPTMVFPACENCTTFIQQVLYIDSLTDVGFGRIIGLGILLIVAFGSFFMSKAFAAEKTLSVTMTITSFIAILLGVMGLLNDKIIYISIIFLVISLYFLLRRE